MMQTYPNYPYNKYDGYAYVEEKSVAKDDELAEEKCEGKECKEEKKEKELKLESFDEDRFDKLVTRYLKETYSNVKSYKTTKAGLNDSTNKVVMEGMITFKSEKTKPTKFVFEAKEILPFNLWLIY